MSAQDRPYSRHYHELVDDPKFAEVYPDDNHYATWGRLLMVADQAWPVSAHIPATARRASVAKLAEVGLIDLLPGGRFRMHGLQAEREQRSQSASHAATSRWSNAERNARRNAERNAAAPGGRMPRQEETRREETSTPRASDDGPSDGLPHVTDPVAAAWSEATGRTVLASGDFALRTLDDLCERQGEASVLAAVPLARRQFERVPSPQQLAAALRNHLEPLPAGRAVPVEEIRREPVARRKAPEIDQAAYDAERRKLAGLAS